MGSGIGVSLESGVSVRAVGCGEGCGVGVSAEVGVAHAVRMRRIVNVKESVWLMLKLSARRITRWLMFKLSAIGYTHPQLLHRSEYRRLTIWSCAQCTVVEGLLLSASVHVSGL